MRLRLLLVPFSLILACLAGAADGPTPDAAPAPDVQDLVFFGDARPVFLRLHLRINGRPFRVVWDEYVADLFRFLDHNGDGVLDKKEAEHVPRAQALRELLHGGTVNASSGRVTFTQLDNHPADGKVTPEELRRYYRRFGVAALQIHYLRVYGTGTNPLTGVLFRVLDTDKDGKLSREEFRRAPEVLHKFDLDDDEMISPQELVPDLFGPEPEIAMPGPDASDRSLTYLPDDAAFLRLSPGETPGRLVEQLLAHYDRDKDQKLSRAEAGLEVTRFNALDVNHDGRLDAEELAQLLQLAPDVELDFRFGGTAIPSPTASLFNPVGVLLGLGRTAAAGPPLGVLLPDGRSPGSPVSVGRSGADTLWLTLADTRIEVRCAGGSGANSDGFRQTLLQQFKDAEVGQRGYVEEKSLQNPQLQALRAIFPLADRDGDGKLTRAELVAVLDLHARGMAGSLLLTLTDRDRGLFELIDANGDGLLGQRELRQAWQRVAPWDRDRDGALARDEVPRKFEITLSQGQPGPARARLPLLGSLPASPSAAPRGPLWFRKMDRNGDGDVSLREFLGNLEDFRKIDADGDGLIDPDEAERADVWFRQRTSQKP